MKRRVVLVAATALIPAVAMPQSGFAKAGSNGLIVALCGGGTVTVPLDGPAAPGNGSSPCCAKGCHSGSSRKRLDRTQ